MAWISPSSTLRLTFESALTPGKVLVMPRISRMVEAIAAFLLCLGSLPVQANLAVARCNEKGPRIAAGPLVIGSRLLEVFLFDVARIDHHLLVVRLVDVMRGQQ